MPQMCLTPAVVRAQSTSLLDTCCIKVLGGRGAMSVESCLKERHLRTSVGASVSPQFNKLCPFFRETGDKMVCNVITIDTS
jgi:hypothetical protein